MGALLPATIEHWLYRYQHGQFAALHNQPRSDKGTQRALDAMSAEALFVLRRQHPELTIKNLVANSCAKASSNPAPTATARSSAA